jgi:hypothetical protein
MTAFLLIRGREEGWQAEEFPAEPDHACVLVHLRAGERCEAGALAAAIEAALATALELRVVEADYLNVRAQPGNGKIVGRVHRHDLLTILEKRSLSGWPAAWGRIEQGWIYLNRTRMQKVLASS